MICIVIYIDVLFVVNFFINFLLLQICAKLTKKEAKLYRLIIASCVGGAYSLIILVDELPSYITLVSKLLVALIMVLISFKFYRLTSFLKTSLVFFFSSLIVLGVVVGISFATKSNMIAINNSSVYFNISAKGLLLSASLAYVMSCVIVRIYNRSLSKNEIYSVEIYNNNKVLKLNAFVDTGNKLREPFSNNPVIIVDREKCEDLIGSSKIRYIPASTVSGETLFVAFKPERIVIKASSESEVVENVYVALSNDVKENGFSAVLNPEILSV